MNGGRWNEGIARLHFHGGALYALIALVTIASVAGCRKAVPGDGLDGLGPPTQQQPRPEDACPTCRARVAFWRMANTPHAEWRDPGERVFSALFESGCIFWQLVSQPDGSYSAYYLISQFGKHGPQADLRLLFGAPHVFLPVASERKLQRWDLPRGVLPLDEAEIRRIRMAVCRYQTELFVRQPNELLRYTHAVFWFRALRADDPHITEVVIDGIVAAMSSHANDDYWWAARNFLVLACATERMDLIAGTPADSLRQSFEQWHRWWRMRAPVLQGRAWARPQFVTCPSVPFPDWTGDVPDLRVVQTYVDEHFAALKASGTFVAP